MIKLMSDLKLPKLGDHKALPKIEFIIGCRKPGTKEGDWFGALIVMNEVNKPVDVILYEDGFDFIGNPSYKKAISIYYDYLKMGWIPMSIYDLEITRKVTIGLTTKTTLD